MLSHLDALNFSDNTSKINGDYISLLIGFDGREGNQFFLIKFLEFIVFLEQEGLARRDLLVILLKVILYLKIIVFDTNILASDLLEYLKNVLGIELLCKFLHLVTLES